ncbi:MAG: Uncharacterised protein [Flavobacteriaceae bacterium]|nr:MAG: Uncharacterised protein [Flavobacteriaceae bacterium]
MYISKYEIKESKYPYSWATFVFFNTVLGARRRFAGSRSGSLGGYRLDCALVGFRGSSYQCNSLTSNYFISHGWWGRSFYHNRSLWTQVHFLVYGRVYDCYCPRKMEFT